MGNDKWETTGFGQKAISDNCVNEINYLSDSSLARKWGSIPPKRL